MSERIFYLGVLLAVSVFCCLIGVSVLVHLATLPEVSSAADEKLSPLPGVAAGREIDEELELRKNLKQQLAQVKRELDKLFQQMSGTPGRKEPVKQLVAELRGLQSQAEELRRKLAGLEEARREHQSRIAELGKTADSLPGSWEDLGQRVAAAGEEQRRLRTRLEELRHQRGDHEKRFSVTALSGGNRRRHRPATFVECTAHEVRIQPAGERFSGTMDPSERQRFLQRIRATGYAVFLIRPDGYQNFLRYRALVLSAGGAGKEAIAIGYEPVNAEWKLIYPQRGD